MPPKQRRRKGMFPLWNSKGEQACAIPEPSSASVGVSWPQPPEKEIATRDGHATASSGIVQPGLFASSPAPADLDLFRGMAPTGTSDESQPGAAFLPEMETSMSGAASQSPAECPGAGPALATLAAGSKLSIWSGRKERPASNLPSFLTLARARAALASLAIAVVEQGACAEIPQPALASTHGITACSPTDPGLESRDGTDVCALDGGGDGNCALAAAYATTPVDRQAPVAAHRLEIPLGTACADQAQAEDIDSPGSEPSNITRDTQTVAEAAPASRRMITVLWTDGGMTQPACEPVDGAPISNETVETVCQGRSVGQSYEKQKGVAGDETAAVETPKLRHSSPSRALVSRNASVDPTPPSATPSRVSAVRPFRASVAAAELPRETVADVPPIFEAIIRPRTELAAAVPAAPVNDVIPVSPVGAGSEKPDTRADTSLTHQTPYGSDRTGQVVSPEQDSAYGSSTGEAGEIKDRRAATAIQHIAINPVMEPRATHWSAAGAPLLAPADGESLRPPVLRDFDAAPETPEAAPSVQVTDQDHGESKAPLRAVSFTVEDARGALVYLKFSERKGAIHLVTRSADDTLSQDIARGLPELKQQLEDAGMAAELWPGLIDMPPMQEPGVPQFQARTRDGGDPGRQAGYEGQQQSRSGGNAAKWMDLIEDALDEGSTGGTR